MANRREVLVIASFLLLIMPGALHPAQRVSQCVVMHKWACLRHLASLRTGEKEVIMQGKVTTVNRILHLTPPLTLVAPSLQLRFSQHLHNAVTGYTGSPTILSGQTHRCTACPVVLAGLRIVRQGENEQLPLPPPALLSTPLAGEPENRTRKDSPVPVVPWLFPRKQKHRRTVELDPGWRTIQHPSNTRLAGGFARSPHGYFRLHNGSF